MDLNEPSEGSVDVHTSGIDSCGQGVHHRRLTHERQEGTTTKQHMLTVRSHEFGRHHNGFIVHSEVAQHVLIRLIGACKHHIICLS